jgi:anti-sigma regulatory factor (Ser/Thr protein kinase)
MLRGQVTLTAQDIALEVTVRDEGVGFNVEAHSPRQNRFFALTTPSGGRRISQLLSPS